MIERKEEGIPEIWTTLPDAVSHVTHTVTELTEGKKYWFRIRAKNMHGLSSPVEFDQIVYAQNPCGMLNI